jgi:hypothetical protein
MAAPLNTLLREKEPRYMCETEQQKAFKLIKEKLCEYSELYYL